MMIPLLEKTKPILAFSYATRIVAASGIVIPTPTADPWSAATVGFEHWWIASDALPPLKLSVWIGVDGSLTHLYGRYHVQPLSETLHHLLLHHPRSQYQDQLQRRTFFRSLYCQLGRDLKICLTCQDNHLDTFVRIYQLIEWSDALLHLFGKGIIVIWSIQSQDKNLSRLWWTLWNVRYLNVRKIQFGIRLRQLNRSWWW